MGITEVATTLRRHWWLIVAGLVIGVLIGGSSAIVRSTTYESTSALIVNPAKPERGQDVGVLASLITSRMETYNALASTSGVLNPVIDELSLDTSARTLQDDISVAVPTGSTIIRITARAPDASAAVDLSDAVARSLSRSIRQTTPSQPGGDEAIKVSTIQNGKDDVQPNKPSLTTSAGVGAVLGGLLAFAVSVVLERLRPRDPRVDAATTSPDTPVRPGG